VGTLPRRTRAGNARRARSILRRVSPAERAVAIAIPTYDRGPVLVETLRHLLELQPAPAELLVVDQSPDPLPDVAAALRRLHDESRIQWIRRSEPSIPAAMNAALLAAAAPVVLFLDDDVVPAADLIARHAAAHASPGRLVAGRVVQPWDAAGDGPHDAPARELTRIGDWLSLVIGANLSVDRAAALAARGFDERFVLTAYRFEADFARRFRAAGGTVHHAASASVRHLRAPGGTRSGSHGLFATRLRQAQGEYYFWLAAGRPASALAALLRRPLTAVSLAHRQRWWADRATAPAAEGLALLRALGAWRRGPRLLPAGGE